MKRVRIVAFVIGNSQATAAIDMRNLVPVVAKINQDRDSDADDGGRTDGDAATFLPFNVTGDGDFLESGNGATGSSFASLPFAGFATASSRTTDTATSTSIP